MKMYSLLLFFVCLNLATFLISTTQAFPNPEVGGTDTEGMSSLFSLQWFFAAAAGGLGTVIAGVLMQNVFLGALAGLIFVGGMFITPINWIFIGFPDLIGKVIKTMCLRADIAVLEADAISGLFANIFTVLISVVFFMFLMELFSQRYIT